jgi:hypothetical protein
MRKWIFLLIVLVILISAMALVILTRETRQLTGNIRDLTTQQPIGDALLELEGTLAATNDQGNYVLPLPRGVVTLTVQADGYAVSQVHIDATNPLSSTLAADVWLEPNRISGTVRDAENDQPIANAQVVIGEMKLATNVLGIFQAVRLKKQAPVVAVAPGYMPASADFDGQTQVALALQPNSISVAVNDRATNKPLANATVQLDGVSIVADAEGRAVLRRVKPGSSIRVTAQGYETVNVAVPNAEAFAVVLRANTLEGNITDATTGQPISGTLVYLNDTIATANAQGKFRIENVPARATIAVRAPGYRKTMVDVSGAAKRDIKLAPFQVRGIRIPFGATTDHVNELVDMVTKTELNALVVDVKSEKGRIAWDSKNQLANDIGARFPQSVDLALVLEACRKHNIYCIARMPVFQDTLLANARPNLAIKYSNGVVFNEGNGTAWTNGFNQDVWMYNIALAKEVAALGFEEIQFDYVRFPGLYGNLYFGVPDTEDSRIAAITGFLARAQKELRATGVFISADVFGLTTATDDDQHIGQRLRDLGPYLDYISPMVYPDTWVRAEDLLSHGLGIPNCIEAVLCPYEVIFNSTKRAMEKTNARVRPWLQAYSGRGDYGITQYKIQKKAANEAGSHGWIFWNGTGNYDIKMFDAKK